MAVLIAQRNFYAAIYESQMACSKAGKDFNLDALGCVERTVPPESPQPPPQPQRLRKPLIEPAPPK